MFAIFAALAVTSACSFNLDPCRNDDDCPPGTSCERPPGTSVPLCLDPEPVLPENNSTTNSGSSTTAGGTNGTHATEPSDESAPVPSCPPIDASKCGGDHEAFPVYLDISPAGCPYRGFDALDEIVSDEVCGGDTDEYALELVACEEVTYTVSITVEARNQCPSVIVELVGGPFRCDMENVVCEVQDQRESITITVPPQRSPQPVETVRFTVRPSDPEQGIEYVMRARVSR